MTGTKVSESKHRQKGPQTIPLVVDFTPMTDIFIWDLTASVATTYNYTRVEPVLSLLPRLISRIHWIHHDDRCSTQSFLLLLRRHG